MALRSTPLYSRWKNMNRRCYSKSGWDFKYYGSRGISVCAEWRHDFLAFMAWALNNGYRDDLQIDRIDNDLGYSPSNCRFTTRSVNCRNRRSSVPLTAFGETKPLNDWLDDPRCPVRRRSMFRRRKSGMTFEQAMALPAFLGGRKVV